MKYLITLVTCACLLGATHFLTGCAGSGKNTAYKTLKTIGDTVDAATRAFAEANAVGAIDAATVQKVRELHEQYRVAFKNAIVAAQFNYEDAAPAQVAALAAELVSLIATYVQR